MLNHIGFDMWADTYDNSVTSSDDYHTYLEYSFHNFRNSNLECTEWIE